MTADNKILPEFAKFMYWFDGYISGLSSTERVDLVKVNASGELDAMLLAVCAEKPESSAVQQTMDIASFTISLDPSATPVHLKNPFSKGERN